MTMQPDLLDNVPKRHHGRDGRQQVPERVVAVVMMIAERHGLTPEDIFGRSRQPAIARARHEACYTLRATPNPNGRFPSWFQIGRWLGGRDHATVWHGARRWAQLSAANDNATPV